MIGEQQARDLAKAFIDAQRNADVDAIMSLCNGDVLFSGLWGPKKLVGSPTGTLRGKDDVRAFMEKALGEWSDVALNMVGAGHSSVVIHAKISGLIGVFYLLILDRDGKIAQIGVHQEVV